jgi:hypothetical protein
LNKIGTTELGAADNFRCDIVDAENAYYKQRRQYDERPVAL